MPRIQEHRIAQVEAAMCDLYRRAYQSGGVVGDRVAISLRLSDFSRALRFSVDELGMILHALSERRPGQFRIGRLDGGNRRVRDHFYPISVRTDA